MMLCMHPWTGLADDVRLGLLTEWVTAVLGDEVLAQCGTRDHRAEALPGAFGGAVDAKGQPAGFPQARVVTLTETGTHSSVDARVGGFCTGEPELAVAMAGSAAGMLVIMDRGFPGVALWKAYTQAGAHLLIRARSSVARRPVQVLDDGTYLPRMNLAAPKGAHPPPRLHRAITSPATSP